jgi:peptidoglycan/LPS O-acetylase OafA/YrhL
VGSKGPPETTAMGVTLSHCDIGPKFMALAPLYEGSLKYRRDIDGLRALAVLSVVFYHIGLPIHGGYVGVDVFFTISGYLIGSILLKETAAGNFTYARFYERRIRRIFPALVVMLAATSLLAYRYLLPLELVDYAKALGGTALSISNFVFWSQTNYFAALSTSAPLLHTWSLAIEEQFYLALPPILFLLNKYCARRMAVAICILCAASFLISIWSVSHYPSATFYLLHTRAWELLLGTIVALENSPKFKSSATREFASIAGIILIAAAALLYRDSTPFPGLAALPPCLGAALVITSGKNGTSVVGRLLSLPPITFIGLISYSLYLWHWPIIIFHNLGFTIINGLNHRETELFLFCSSLAMGTISYWLIETPFRRQTKIFTPSRLFFGSAAVTLIIAACVASAVLSRGFPSRLPERAQRIAAYMGNDPDDPRDQNRFGTCFIATDTATLGDFSVPTCLPERPDEKSVLVLGDSHAAALWWGLHEIFPSVNVMQATASGCKPVLHQRPRQSPTCTAIMQYVIEDFLLSHRVNLVLIEAHWDDGDVDNISETVAWFQRHSIPFALVGPITQYDSSLPRLLAMSVTNNDPGLPSRHLNRFVQPLDARLETLAERDWRVPYVSLINLFCSNGTCAEYATPGVPLLTDYSHLTKRGSVLAACRIATLKIPELNSPDLDKCRY